MPPTGATKADVISAIAERLGIEAPTLSTGSTEPRSLFTAIDEALGLGIESRTKQNMAREIVERSGAPWKSTYESAGATITLDGLRAVAEAVDTIDRAGAMAPVRAPFVGAVEVLNSYPDWASSAAAATSAELALLEELADVAAAGTEAPTVGDEVCDGIPLSLAWQGRRVTVRTWDLDPDVHAALHAEGWMIVEPVASDIRAALKGRGSSEEV